MVKLMLALARILSWSTPKYTESAPLSIAACSDSKFPAGAISSIFPVFVIIYSDWGCKGMNNLSISQLQPYNNTYIGYKTSAKNAFVFFIEHIVACAYLHIHIAS